MRYLFFLLLVLPSVGFTQNDESLQQSYCECLQTGSEQRLDSLLALSPSLNAPCTITYQSRRLVQDGLTNAWRATKDFFTRKSTPKQRTYTTHVNQVPPIMLAKDKFPWVEKLLQAGADPTQYTEDSPSLAAAYIFESSRKRDGFELLIKYKTDFRNVPISSKDPEIIDLVLANGGQLKNLVLTQLGMGHILQKNVERYDIRLDTLDCYKIPDNFKRLPVTFLVKRGMSIDCLGGKALVEQLERKLPASYRLRRGDFVAFREEEEELMTFLRQLDSVGVNFNQCATFDKTPLSEVSSSGSVRATKLLLELGADADFKCDDQQALGLIEKARSYTKDSALILRLDSVIDLVEADMFDKGKKLPSPSEVIQMDDYQRFVERYGMNFTGLNLRESSVNKAIQKKSAQELIFLLDHGLPLTALTEEHSSEPPIIYRTFRDHLPDSDDLTDKFKDPKPAQDAFLELLKRLNKADFDFMFYPKKDKPLLYRAAEAGNPEVVRFLLEHGVTDAPFRYGRQKDRKALHIVQDYFAGKSYPSIKFHRYEPKRIELHEEVLILLGGTRE
ncbi:MAG: hypothetical protein AAF740_00600 [Bacteroidota bacterium]